MPLYGLKKQVWTPMTDTDPNTGQPYFGAGCANYGGWFPICQFYKDPMTFVHLRGLMSFPGGANVTVFTLPVGYRPGLHEMFAILCTYAGGQIGFRFDVLSDGTGVTRSSSAASPTGSYLSIDGITFAAEL